MVDGRIEAGNSAWIAGLHGLRGLRGMRGEDPGARDYSAMRSHFRDLVAYRRAAALGDELHREIATWSAFDRYGLGVQLLRAADSIGANIAEAAGRWSLPDRRRFLIIARGSLYETEHWLARAHERGLVAQERIDGLRAIAVPLTGLIRAPAPT